MGFTTDGLTLVLNYAFTTETVSRPTAWKMALHTGDPGADGSANEVDTGTDADYVRQSVTFAAESGGRCLNNLAASWTVNSGSAGYTVTHATVWDVTGTPVCLMSGELTVHKTLAASDVQTFSVGQIVAAID